MYVCVIMCVILFTGRGIATRVVEVLCVTCERVVHVGRDGILNVLKMTLKPHCICIEDLANDQSCSGAWARRK